MNVELKAQEVRVIEFNKMPMPGDTFRAQGLLWTIIEIEKPEGGHAPLKMKAQETNWDGTRTNFIAEMQWRGWNNWPTSQLQQPKRF